MTYAKITTEASDPKFQAGAEIFEFDEKNPEVRRRMPWDNYQALLSCRTPAANFTGPGKAGQGDILCPFRFLGEFHIEETDTDFQPDSMQPAPPKSLGWDNYALEMVETHARALKAKCEEITRRCNLPTVTDYTVKMALRELAQAPS